MSKSMTANTLFTTDLDFCPDCGSVLPLPGHEDVVTCKLCNYKIDVNGKKNLWCALLAIAITF